MFRLAVVIYILAATFFAGSAVIAVLSMHMMGAMQITGAFFGGLVLALPVAWLVARNIYTSMNGRRA